MTTPTTLLTLFCLVDGETNSFPVDIEPSKTVAHLKEFIKATIPNTLNGVDAKDLNLWRVNHVIAANKHQPVLLKSMDSASELNPMDDMADVFQAAPPKKTIHIIVQRPSPQELDLPANKKIRITEGWTRYTASDGKAVDLPPSWIGILAGAQFEPAPRAAFAHLKNYLQAGDAIDIPSLGQVPMGFGSHGQGQKLFVTEQMLELWENMRGDQERTYRRILAGPMGVGKSYLSYFLVARAYAEGWLVLYMSNARVLDMNEQDEAALKLLKRFLALNKDILTGAELEKLVCDYNGMSDISTRAVSGIFETLLKSPDRKTLLLVDEHGGLFGREPYVTDRFKSLVPLSSFNVWGEINKGSRVIFTGTAHAKFELKILNDGYRPTSVVFVGPLSKNVFSKLLGTYPRLAAPDIREEVLAITNCVPRELVVLSADVRDLPEPISMHDLQEWTKSRSRCFLAAATMYYQSLSPFRKKIFYKALLQTFLGNTSAVGFDWDFFDLGLIYRSKDVGRIGTQYHILCRPAQRALLERLKMLPLPEGTGRRICDGSLGGDDFETALCHQLICTAKPIVLNATDLNGSNPTTIALNFSHCGTLQIGETSLGSGHDNVLTRSYEGYPRFDFMLGALFIQASISDFGRHNAGSADLSKAFDIRDANGTNQIERYLNDLYGPGHSAKIDVESNRFVVTKDGVPVSGFRVVYIRGSPGKPSHRDLVKRFPDVRHVSFEEVTRNLFRNIITYSDLQGAEF
ncbi:hypothetical protein DFQ27_009680 [Actinomortierella ambigua]|uniref:Crinkler effector protein N-terminal domain-containing protein n=1 Tax=Actinomortierella ambigua TaxID=1343610 RepID=A0A9P6PMG5_9FUNG|nr:hypothetical protein DFQ27_009680 [Actinomortierella ambigua]